MKNVLIHYRWWSKYLKLFSNYKKQKLLLNVFICHCHLTLTWQPLLFCFTMVAASLSGAYWETLSMIQSLGLGSGCTHWGWRKSQVTRPGYPMAMLSWRQQWPRFVKKDFPLAFCKRCWQMLSSTITMQPQA